MEVRMKRTGLIVCGLLVLIVFSDCSRGEAPAKNDTVTTIMNRKSVRSFTGEAVPAEKLDTILKAAMAAPSAMDKRPWEFILITDRTVLKKLADSLPYAKMTANAGAAIVVAGDTKRSLSADGIQFWIMDCSAASQNILLAVESLGLGAVWTAVYPDKDRLDAVTKILGIPPHVIPLNLIPIGIPKGDHKPKDKFDASRIHMNRW